MKITEAQIKQIIKEELKKSCKSKTWENQTT